MTDTTTLRGPTSTSTANYDVWLSDYQRKLQSQPQAYSTGQAAQTELQRGYTEAQKDVDSWLAKLNAAKKTAGATGYPVQYYAALTNKSAPIGVKFYTIAQLEFNLKVAIKVRDAAKKKLDEIPSPSSGEGTRFGDLNKGTLTVSPRTATKYNIPSVREAYHASSTSFLESFNDDGINSPAQVKQAIDLWTNFAKSGNSKGMIQSLNYLPSDVVNQVMPSELGKGVNLKAVYGFQFLYNPNRIDMTFNSVTGIDVAAAIQDSQNFNLLGTSDAPSTVNFSILINRMLDMKYINSHGIRPEFKIENVYGTNFKVNNQDLANIYNKGTMYDVEFLLNTLTGFTLPNAITGKQTPDFGFIGARPVELHLGPNLRYIVRIDNFSISHKAFNRRMVPIYTELELSCGRLPWTDTSLASQPGSLAY